MVRKKWHHRLQDNPKWYLKLWTKCTQGMLRSNQLLMLAVLLWAAVNFKGGGGGGGKQLGIRHGNPVLQGRLYVILRN